LMRQAAGNHKLNSGVRRKKALERIDSNSLTAVSS
jgi:hypothetical protein